MSIGVIATVFAVVAVAELPDKTMIATLVMGSRSRPLWVWSGASAAFTLHVALAVAAGRLLELLPHRVLDAVVGVLFLAGAGYLLLVPEREAVAEGDREARGSNGDGATSGPGAPEGTGTTPAGPDGRPRTTTGAFRVMATAFGVILVGEFGDLTQLLTINLVARFRQPWSVAVGALAALVAVAALGAFGGRILLRFLSVNVIRRIGGVILLGFAGYTVYTLVR
ncbi:MAG TPA: TMEM165/GDT1 family protein [Acidimicrobiales bacterium]|jgi:putative Ca2+/H+ antiporter (TMEM165/GDT1 family)